MSCRVDALVGIDVDQQQAFDAQAELDASENAKEGPRALLGKRELRFIGR